MDRYEEKIKQQLVHLAREEFNPDLAYYGVQFIEEKCKEKLIFSGLTIVHYRMFGGTSEEIYRIGAAVELALLALDIFDDLQDQDQPNIAWSQCDPAISLNTALGFILLARQTLSDSGFPADRLLEVEKCWDRALLTAVNGQTTDLINRIATEDEYYEMIKQKSASLIVMACMTGALLATGQWNDTIAQYAGELGFASQLKNDIRDLLNWDTKNDFVHRKRTLLTLYLMNYAPPEYRWIRDYFEKEEDLFDPRAKRSEIEELLQSTGAFVYSKAKMKVHYYQYLSLVESLDVDPMWRRQLVTMIE